MGEPPDLGFDDLKDNFYKRTYSFTRYQEKLLPHNPRLLYWIGSVNYSGYTRETSLKYLITHYQPGDENRILLRLEDWVPKIQARAQQWTKKNFHTLSLHQLNSNYQLLLYLSRKEKLQQSPILQLINTCLVNKVQEVEQSQFSVFHPRFRRYFYVLALPENTKLRQWLLVDTDSFSRTLLLQLYPYDELTSKEIHRLQHDKSAMVRRKTLNVQIQRNIRPTQDILLQYCLDKNASIREYARFYVQKFYDIDAYNLYIEQENDTFYYLADYAKKEDCDVFLDGMHSQNSQIKYLCLKALCRIDATYLRQLDVKKLLADNRKIRKVTCASLPHVMTTEQLRELKETLIHVHPRGMQIFLHMLYRKSFW